MNGEQVLRNDLSFDGIRRIHIIRMGKRVDAERWLQLVPEAAMGMLARPEWEESGLGMHHLLLAWRAREVVSLAQLGTDAEAVMWGIDQARRQPVRQAIDEAASWHKAVYDELPDLALVSSRFEGPVGMMDRINGHPIYTMRWVDTFAHYAGAWEMEVRTAGWVPVGSVVVMGHGDTVMEEVEHG
jgi:hypothetical protein